MEARLKSAIRVKALIRRVLGRSIAGVVAPVLLAVALVPAGLGLTVAYLGLPPVAAVLIVIASSAFLAWKLSRSTAKRLREPLQAGMASIEKVAGGTLEENAPAAEIREFAELSDSFNTMTAKFRESTARLVHKAFHDPLTGLPNRALFMTRIQQALTNARHRQERETKDHEPAAIWGNRDHSRSECSTTMNVIGCGYAD